MMSEEPKKKYDDLPPLFVVREDIVPAVPIWKGQTAYILGGGPSFSPDLAPLLRGKNVIGCNEAYRLGGDIISFCHFLDLPWWNEHKEEAQTFTGRFTTCEPLVDDPKVLVFKHCPRGIDFVNKDTLGHNRSTGLSAINLAIHLGATRIILLGFDMGSADDGSTHWYPRENEANRATLRMHRRAALEVAEDVSEHGGIEIINASPASQLPYWPKITPQEALSE